MDKRNRVRRRRSGGIQKPPAPPDYFPIDVAWVPSDNTILQVMERESQFPVTHPRRHYFDPEEVPRLAQVLGVQPTLEMWYRLHFLKARFVIETIESGSEDRVSRAVHELATRAAASDEAAAQILSEECQLQLDATGQTAVVALRSWILGQYEATQSMGLDALTTAARIRSSLAEAAAEFKRGRGTGTKNDPLYRAIAGALEIAWLYNAEIIIPSSSTGANKFVGTPAFHFVQDYIEILCDSGLQFIEHNIETLPPETRGHARAEFERIKGLAENTLTGYVRDEWKAVERGLVRSPIAPQIRLSEEIAGWEQELPA